MPTKKLKNQNPSPHDEFYALCKKYPKVKFVGNTTFNLETLKKGMWLFHPDAKKSLISPGDEHIVIRNIFKGKFNEKGKQ